MMGRLRTATAVAVGVLALVGGLALGMHLAVDRTSPEPASSAPELTTDAQPVPVGDSVVALPGSTPLDLTFTLQGADPSSLAEFLSELENPFSSQYERYLTAPEFESEFAPSPGAVAEVERVLQEDGATSVEASPARLAVEATIPAARVEALLGVSLQQVGGGVSLRYTAVGPARLPAALQGLVIGVGGLSNLGNSGFFLPMSADSGRLQLGTGTRPSFITGSTPGSQWFVGSDFTSAFGADDLFPGSGTTNATYPTHVAIATLLASGWNQTENVDLPPFNPVAVDFYYNATLAPSWPHSSITGVPVTYGGLTPPGPGGNGDLNDSTGDQVENSLDLEMAGSLAPGAPLYNFYLSGKLVYNDPEELDVADAFGVALGSALNYSYGSARLGLVSASFGGPDLNDSLWNSDLEMAEAMGVTVVVSSGDQGNAPNSVAADDDGQWPTWPATAAFNTSGVLAVGGVSLLVDGVPTGEFNENTGFEIEYDSNITGIESLVTWYNAQGVGGVVGSEGGLSEVIPEPYWQFHSAAQPAISAAAGKQGATMLGRAEPDLSFPANNTIVAYLANSTGAIFGGLVGGTSISAPALAGLLADEIAVRSDDGIGATWSPLGYLDPVVYRMGSYYAANPNAPTPAWIDVTEGSNYVFSAGTGWDATTGWGTPTGLALLNALANPTITGYVYTGPTPGLPAAAPGPSIPWTEIYLVFGVAIVVAIVLVVLFARPRRPTTAPVPYGAQLGGAAAPFPSAGGGPTTPGATFLCPYCGAARPAEPVRCPRCGAY